MKRLLLALLLPIAALGQQSSPPALPTNLYQVVPAGTIPVVSTPGVFTAAQQNNTSKFTINSPCTYGNPSENSTDALAACINVPASGVGSPLLTNAIAAYAQTANGQFGGNATNAFYGTTICNAVTECEGISLGVRDNSGVSGSLLVGYEADFITANTGSTGFGFFAQMQGNSQPTADTFPGYATQFSGTAKFTSGYKCLDASIVSTAAPPRCFNTGKQATAGSTNSNTISFVANDGSADFSSYFSLAGLGHFMESTAPALIQTNPTGIEANGIMLTSTVALATNLLVKIDTANADSVVVCTTADTSCDGFVGDQLGTAGFCTATSIFCAIITVPGSKAKGILGTGTCAIGNFVIVDTTTNGRIKCQATIPAAGAYIGKALSAQAAVGSTVDVLTKFQ